MVHMESIIFAEALARISSFLFKGIELVISGFLECFSLMNTIIFWVARSNVHIEDDL